MATHTCPRCEYEITEDEDYCEECQWSIDLTDYLDNATGERMSDLLSDILFALFHVPSQPWIYSNSHTIDSYRIEKVRKAIDADLKRWKASKEAASA